MPRRSLAGLVAAVAVAVVGAVVAPIAIARAAEHGAAQPAPSSRSNAGPRADHIDMTGATPAGDGELGFGPAEVPGLYYCRTYRIWSLIAGRYLAEEQGYDGDLHNLLRARTAAGSAGPWEQFGLCSSDGGHTIYLKAPSGYLVSAEFGLAGAERGMLRGRGEWVDVWETFDVWSDNGRYYLRNPSKGTYFTCRVDYTGALYEAMKATGSAPGSWEALRFDPV